MYHPARPPRLLSRSEFRTEVLIRDGFRCLNCGRGPSDGIHLDAHHILERRLWPDGGYYLDNGATLCDPECHLLAEQTLVTPAQLREAAQITRVLLPPHLYEEYAYDKWGNIVLPNGARLKGELFFDESVQKVLVCGGVLDRFLRYVKHPRLHHLPFSPGLTKGDRRMPTIQDLTREEISVSIKLDGEQTTLYTDHVHPRALEYSHRGPAQSEAKRLWSRTGYLIPQDWRVSVENLTEVHTIRYHDLSSLFPVHSIWNDQNICLSVDETAEWAALLNLQMVPEIYRGPYDENVLRELVRELHDSEKVEGIVVRASRAFPFHEHPRMVGKYVHQEFAQRRDAQHGIRRTPQRNELERNHSSSR